MSKLPERFARRGLGWLLGLAVGMGCCATAPAQSPAWWTNRGVLVTNLAPSDYALANQGQVKWLATNAYNEFQLMLPGDNSGLHDAVSGFTQTGNYLPVNLGQLKALAKPFYDRITAVAAGEPYLTNARPTGVTTNYPWTYTITDDADYAPANLGQVKYVWSIDFDRDANGLPDWWEMRVFGNLSQSATDDPDGDGCDNLCEYQNGTDPGDYFNGLPPCLTLSGDNRIYAQSNQLMMLLTALISDTDGLGLTNAPLVFGVSNGAALFAATTNGTGTTNLLVRSDAAGLASAWLCLPTNTFATNELTLRSYGGTNETEAQLAAWVTDPHGSNYLFLSTLDITNFPVPFIPSVKIAWRNYEEVCHASEVAEGGAEECCADCSGTNYLRQKIEMMEGGAMRLTWCSRTDEVYRIEYSTTLTNWLTAVENFPNQGTNTVWVDLGRETGLTNRLSSADISEFCRFYRVAVDYYMSNALPASITISNASNGTILTELTNLFIGVESSSNVVTGKLLVDGNQIGMNSGTSFSFPLETRFYPNGIHRLSVVAEDEGDLGTTGGDDSVPDPTTDTRASYATTNLTVIFSNSLSDVWLKYKSFHPELGQTQELHAILTPPRSWHVDIASADDTNTIYRTFSGSGQNILIQWDGLDTNGLALDPQRIAYVIIASPPFLIYQPYKTLGTFGMLYQGHHPYPPFGPSNRPQRGSIFGQATLTSSHNPPWGGIKSGKRIADELGASFWISGYQIQFIHGDDDVTSSMLQKSSLGGSELFNQVNIGLYVGHSSSTVENIVALNHPQSYIPIYHTGAGSMDWVGMNDMDWGGSNLKWLAFYSCNLFRSSSYRANGCFSQMKNNNHLAMNSDLHIMQAYATEVSVHPSMGEYWTRALMGRTANSANHTVLGAWRYVCINTQPRESSSEANVSRSIYWPECAGDHIYGYGSQTDPDPGNIQSSDLQEDDQMAPTL